MIQITDMGREGGLIIRQRLTGSDVAPEVYDYYRALVGQRGGYR